MYNTRVRRQQRQRKQEVALWSTGRKQSSQPDCYGVYLDMEKRVRTEELHIRGRSERFKEILLRTVGESYCKHSNDTMEAVMDKQETISEGQ